LRIHGRKLLHLLLLLYCIIVIIRDESVVICCIEEGFCVTSYSSVTVNVLSRTIHLRSGSCSWKDFLVVWKIISCICSKESICV